MNLKLAFSLLFFSLTAFGQFDFCDDFSDANAWTQVGSRVTVANGQAEFQTQSPNGQQRRMYRELLAELYPGMDWEVKFKFHPTNLGTYQGQPFVGHVLFGLTAGNGEMYSDCPNIPCTGFPTGTQDGILFNLQAENPPTPIPYFRITVRDSITETHHTSRIDFPGLGVDYFIHFAKIGNDLICGIYSDSTYSTHIPGSPVTMSGAVADLNPLRFVQMGAVARGDFRRQLTATTDDLCFKYLNPQDSIIPVCENDSVFLIDSTQHVYRWSTGTAPGITFSTDSSIWAHPSVDPIFYAHGHDRITTYHLQYQSIVFDLGLDDTICRGDTLPLTSGLPSNDLLFTWHDGSTDSTFLAADEMMHHLQVEDTMGCTFEDSVFITVFDYPPVDLGPNRLVCDEDSVILNAGNSNYTYLWNTQETDSSIVVDQNGQYTVQVFNAHCMASDTVNITFFDDYKILDSNQVLCEGDSYLVDLSGFPVSVLWSDGSTDLTRTFTQSGTFAMQATDTSGCVLSDSMEFIFHPLPDVELDVEFTTCADTAITLEVSHPNSEYLWNTGDLTPSITINESGLYWVMVTNEFGCSQETSSTITYYDCTPILELPNIFTPNNDQTNDVFTPREIKNIVDMETVILNRWGKTVFQSNTLEINWTGDNLNEGTYFYMVKYHDLERNKGIKQGQVFLKR